MHSKIQPDISSDLITSYRCANYQIGTEPDAITLRINQYSEPLSQLLAASDPSCAVFITAYNPFSQRQNAEKNLTAHALLGRTLRHHSNQIIESISTDPSGTWPPEKSFLAFGINLDTAKALGRQFSQNAIVWIDTDAIPRLILLC